MRVVAETMIDEGTFAEYFCSTEEPSESRPIVYRPEIDHLNHISSVNARWWTLKSQKIIFKEVDAYWLSSPQSRYITRHSLTSVGITIKQ
jgi:hypothetical protein